MNTSNIQKEAARCKKWITGIVMAAAIACFLPGNVVKAGQDINNPTAIPVNVVNTMSEMNACPVSYAQEFHVQTDDENVNDYLQFTITEDSIVNFSIYAEEIGDGVYIKGDCGVRLYSDISYTNELAKYKAKKNAFDSSYVQALKAGTYYIKVTASKLAMWNCHYKQSIKVSAIPVKNIYTVTANPNKNKVTVSVNKGVFESITKLKYYKGIDTAKHFSQNYVNGTVDILQAGSFTVKENAIYTLYVEIDDDNYFAVQIDVNNIDTVKPTVTGVKNGKTYKKKVTIKFFDKGSGIKKATLNGKKIKAGKKVSKRGSYTLKVWDRAGNLRTVKFKIK